MTEYEVAEHPKKTEWIRFNMRVPKCPKKNNEYFNPVDFSYHNKNINFTIRNFLQEIMGKDNFKNQRVPNYIYVLENEFSYTCKHCQKILKKTTDSSSFMNYVIEHLQCECPNSELYLNQTQVLQPQNPIPPEMIKQGPEIKKNEDVEEKKRLEEEEELKQAGVSLVFPGPKPVHEILREDEKEAISDYDCLEFQKEIDKRRMQKIGLISETEFPQPMEIDQDGAAHITVTNSSENSEKEEFLIKNPNMKKLIESLNSYQKEVSFQYFIHGNFKNWKIQINHYRNTFKETLLPQEWLKPETFMNFWLNGNGFKESETIVGNSRYCPLKNSLPFFFKENSLAENEEENPFLKSPMYTKYETYTSQFKKKPIILNIFIDGFTFYDDKWRKRVSKKGIYYTIANSKKRMTKPLLIALYGQEDEEKILSELKDDLNSLFKGFKIDEKELIAMVGFLIFDHEEKVKQTLSQDTQGNVNCSHCVIVPKALNFFTGKAGLKNSEFAREYYETYKYLSEMVSEMEGGKADVTVFNYDDYLEEINDADLEMLNSAEITAEERKELETLKSRRDSIKKKEFEIIEGVEKNCKIEEKITKAKKLLKDIQKDAFDQGIQLTGCGTERKRRICIWLEIDQSKVSRKNEKTGKIEHYLFNMYSNSVPEPMHTIEFGIFKNYFFYLFDKKDSKGQQCIGLRRIFESYDFQSISNKKFTYYINEKTGVLVDMQKRVMKADNKIVPMSLKGKFSHLIDYILEYKKFIWIHEPNEETRNKNYQTLMMHLNFLVKELQEEREREGNTSNVSLPHEKNHLEEFMHYSNGCFFLIHAAIFEHFHRTMKKYLLPQGGGINPVAIVFKKWILNQIGVEYLNVEG